MARPLEANLWSSIWVAQNVANKPPKNFVGQKFWARGYFVSTVGVDEKVIKAYIQTKIEMTKSLKN